MAFHDVDVAGVVWHGHYLKYLENARWALMDRLDFGLRRHDRIRLRLADRRAAREVCAVPRASATGWRCALRWSSGRTAWPSTIWSRTQRRQSAWRARETVQVAVEAATGALQFATPAVLLERVARGHSAVQPQREPCDGRSTSGTTRCDRDRRRPVRARSPAALLKRRGWDVLVLEAQRFPRFSIGESLLAHCLDFVDEAGMMPAVEAPASSTRTAPRSCAASEYGEFDFGDKFTPGRDSTYQVQRAAFDKVLADEAEKQGVEIRYEVRVAAVDGSGAEPRVRAIDASGREYDVEARFILDASGFGRTLPKLLDLETPSTFPVRNAVFTHVADRAPRRRVRPQQDPGRRASAASRRVVLADSVSARPLLARLRGAQGILRALIRRRPTTRLRKLVERGAVPDARAGERGRGTRRCASCPATRRTCKSMHGPGFALLGNAAEFLDPVFSSGVTIAMRSASMAAHVLDRQLRGEQVDWTAEFETPLRKGVDTFRAYVRAWYDGRFQDIMFAKTQPPEIRRMICSILAGYAWDENNPFVAEPERRLDMVAKLCAA